MDMKIFKQYIANKSKTPIQEGVNKKITAVLLAAGKVVKQIPCKTADEAHKHVASWLDSGDASEKRSGSINVDMA